VELLAVMGIMAIIYGITIASFSGLSRGGATQGGARSVQGAIKLARQQAVARRSPVAFIVADGLIAKEGINGKDPLAGPQDQYLNLIGKAYAIYDLHQNTFLKTWTELPTGVIFVDEDTKLVTLPTGKNTIGGNRKTSEPNVIDEPIAFPAGFSIDTNCLFYGVTYLPTGRMYTSVGSPDYYWFLIAEGAQKGTEKPTPRPNTIVYGIRCTIAGGVELVEFGNAQNN
jgi:type II secretory pathway pseudopilin PulG